MTDFVLKPAWRSTCFINLNRVGIDAMVPIATSLQPAKSTTPRRFIRRASRLDLYVAKKTPIDGCTRFPALKKPSSPRPMRANLSVKTINYSPTTRLIRIYTATIDHWVLLDPCIGPLMPFTGVGSPLELYDLQRGSARSGMDGGLSPRKPFRRSSKVAGPRVVGGVVVSCRVWSAGSYMCVLVEVFKEFDIPENN